MLAAEKTHLPCRVVSTSLIEAGVDVNFPAVFREEAGLDSILRPPADANREGGDSPEDSIVTIFKGEDKPPKLFETAIGAGQMAMSKYKDIASREAIPRLFPRAVGFKRPGEPGCPAHPAPDGTGIFPFSHHI